MSSVGDDENRADAPASRIVPRLDRLAAGEAERFARAEACAEPPASLELGSRGGRRKRSVGYFRSA